MNSQMELLWSSAPSEYAWLTMELYYGDRILRVDQENGFHDLNVTLLTIYPAFTPRVNFGEFLTQINDIKRAFIERFTGVNVICPDKQKIVKRKIELKWSKSFVRTINLVIDGISVLSVDQESGLGALNIDFLLLPHEFDARVNFDDFLKCINEIKLTFFSNSTDL